MPSKTPIQIEDPFGNSFVSELMVLAILILIFLSYRVLSMAI
jgi:hypothetical protein